MGADEFYSFYFIEFSCIILEAGGSAIRVIIVVVISMSMMVVIMKITMTHTI